MTKRLRELLLLVGSGGLAYEVVIQGGSRPEVMTAMISLIATAGALKVDEARKDSAPSIPPPKPAGDSSGRKVIKVGDKHVIVDADGNVVDE